MEKKFLDQEWTLEDAPDEEGWGEYSVRNIAKIPALAYESLRSGFGLGDLLAAVTPREKPELVAFLEKHLGEENKNAPKLLPTGAEARQEISRVLPKYMTESRPGDYPAELLAMAAPHIVSAGMSGGIPALLKAAAVSAGALGLGHAGAEAGGALGSVAGNEALGRILGGVGGGLGGGVLTHGLINRPSKFFPKKVAQIEQQAFEGGKAGRIAEVARENIAKIAQAEEMHAKKLAEYKKEFSQKTLEVPKQKALFESEKKSRIDAARKVIADYDKKIEGLEKGRHELYSAAKNARGNASGDAAALYKTIESIGNDIYKGVETADRNKILNNLISLEKDIKRDGTLSLNDAVTYQKNINAQRFDPGASNAVKSYLGELSNSLNDFIKTNGSAEHNAAWQKAEKMHKDLVQLRAERPEIHRDTKQLISDISKEKFSPITESHLKQEGAAAKKDLGKLESEHARNIAALESEYKSFVKDIGKESFESFLKSDHSKLASSIRDLVDKKPESMASRYGVGGIGALLGYMGGGKIGGIIGGVGSSLGKAFKREVDIARKVFASHPQLKREYFNTIKEASKRDLPYLVAQTSKLGAKIEDYLDDDREELLNSQEWTLE